jgi:hypothetical protein
MAASAMSGAVPSGGVDQPVEDVLGCGSSIGPLRLVEQRVDDVDRSQADVDGVVHVAPQRFAAGRRFGEGSLAPGDRLVEHVLHHRMEE